jgi:hypothetical protein
MHQKGYSRELGCHFLKIDEIKHHCKHSLDDEREGNINNSIRENFNKWTVHCHLMVAKDDQMLGENIRKNGYCIYGYKYFIVIHNGPL